MKKVIFGDMHNREFVVKDLFHKIGLMDSEGNRAEGFHTIQLGDLLSLGYGEQEAAFRRWVKPFIDEQLIGNHELPAFTHYPNLVEFWGWDRRDTIAESMVRSEHTAGWMGDDIPDLWKPATHVGDWLITHAGLSIRGQKELGVGKTAKEYADALNDLWRQHLEDRDADPLFLSTGQHNGGIFWIRIEYLRAGYRDVHVPQIVGHTPFDHNKKFQPPALQNKDGNLWCIDSPGSCVAMITEDDGKTWEKVISDYEVKYGEERNRGVVYYRGTDEIVK